MANNLVNSNAKFVAGVFVLFIGMVMAGRAVWAQEAGPAPAVDGINGKITGLYGTSDGEAHYFSEGSITLPLGHRFGVQFDGVVGALDEERAGDSAVYGAAAHLFWRDPSKGLFGLYGDYYYIDAFGGVETYNAAIQGAVYRGRITVDGKAGIEGGNSPADFAPFGAGKLNIDTGLFSSLAGSYYPDDNLRLTVGYVRSADSNAGLFQAEWGIDNSSTYQVALFARGTVTEEGHTASAGVRLYLGQKAKPLIRRHREDDPRGVGFAIASWIKFKVHQGFPNCRIC